MKKPFRPVLAVLAVLAAAVTMTAPPAQAAPACSGSSVQIDVYCVELTGSPAAATITGYTGPGGALVIPASFTDAGVTYPTTGIWSGAFNDKDLTGVVIPATVTAINQLAFADNVGFVGATFLGPEPATMGVDVFGYFPDPADGPLVSYYWRYGEPQVGSGFTAPTWEAPGVGGNVYRSREIAVVTFDSREGSAVAAAEVVVGTAPTLPAAPTRAGHTFAGWFTDGAATQAFDATAGVTGDLTLYAGWTAEASTPAPTATATLPRTGSSAGALAALAGVVVLGGVAALVLARRRGSD